MAKPSRQKAETPPPAVPPADRAPRPYATMDESDVKDCGSNRNADVAFDLADGAGAATAQPDAGEAMDAAAEADAAATGASTKQ